MDLVILAAGIGNRFGGLKQIKPIDKNGNFIIDYSIYDAIKVGFDKIIFIINENNFDIFKSTIGKRVEKYIKVEYAFQNLDSFIKDKELANKRLKPWGTGHAILCAKNKVDGNFAVINADDFYGRESLYKIANFLKQSENNKDFAMVGFKAKNTMSENGGVKRGICEINNGNLISLNESLITKNSLDDYYAKSIQTENSLEKQISPDTLVSMNLFGFTKNLFPYLENSFDEFINNKEINLATTEYFIPTVVSNYINNNLGKLKVLDTDEMWYGLTYKEDFDSVCNGINNLVLKGVYPSNLWQ